MAGDADDLRRSAPGAGHLNDARGAKLAQNQRSPASLYHSSAYPSECLAQSVLSVSLARALLSKQKELLISAAARKLPSGFLTARCRSPGTSSISAARRTAPCHSTRATTMSRSLVRRRAGADGRGFGAAGFPRLAGARSVGVLTLQGTTNASGNIEMPHGVFGLNNRMFLAQAIVAGKTQPSKACTITVLYTKNSL